MKKATFHILALKVLRKFPKNVRYKVGKAIYQLQIGKSLSLPISRGINSISEGAEEIRIKDRILIFHAFQKKTQKTPQVEIRTAKNRLKELLDEQINNS